MILFETIWKGPQDISGCLYISLPNTEDIWRQSLYTHGLPIVSSCSDGSQNHLDAGNPWQVYQVSCCLEKVPVHHITDIAYQTYTILSYTCFICSESKLSHQIYLRPCRNESAPWTYQALQRDLKRAEGLSKCRQAIPANPLIERRNEKIHQIGFVPL